MDIKIQSESIVLSTSEKNYIIKSQNVFPKVILFLENSIEAPLLFLVTLEKMLQEKNYTEI